MNKTSGDFILKINVKYLKDAALYVEASGKLDIYNAQDYLDEIKKNLGFTKELILDFSNIDYIASIGLRAVLELHKIMKEKECPMIIKNVRKDVLNIFKTTGFDSFLNIENDEEES